MSEILSVRVCCDLCNKDLDENSDDRNTGEILMRGSRWKLDLCNDCADPLFEKLAEVVKIECPECGRTFEKKHGLPIHRRLAHGILTENSK